MTVMLKHMLYWMDCESFDIKQICECYEHVNHYL